MKSRNVGRTNAKMHFPVTCSDCACGICPDRVRDLYVIDEEIWPDTQTSPQFKPKNLVEIRALFWNLDVCGAIK